MIRVILPAVMVTPMLAMGTVLAQTGDTENGRKIAIRHCARCHVIPDHNPLGGIGSTPSFRALTYSDDYVDRMRTFFSRHPHPVFVRVPGEPRWSDAPAYAPEFEINLEQIEDLVEFVKTFDERP